MNRKLFFLLLIFIATAGMFALWRSTTFGAGLTNDSSYYIEGARNILAGNGYTRTSGGGEVKPITHFPPFFSIILALFTLAGLDTIAAARVLVILLFGVTIFLAGLSILRISRSPLFALFGAVLLASSDVFLSVYSMALSEPLFLVLILAGILCLLAAVEKESARFFLLSGFVMGLSVLTRYAGVSLLVASGLFILGYAKRQPWKKIVYLAAGALPPIAIWLILARYTSGSETVGNRLLTWHPPSIQRLFEAAKNLLTWLAPDGLLAFSPLFGRLLSLLALLVLPALVIFLGYSIWRTAREGIQPGRLEAASIFALQSLVYLAFLLISLTFFDASTPLDTRILSPAYLALLILFAGSLGWLWQRRTPSSVWIRWASLGVLVFAVAVGVLDGARAVRQLARDGQGFANSGWRESPAIQAVSELPATLIFSNKPTGIYLLTGKSSYVLPTPTDVVTAMDRPDFVANLNSMKEKVLRGEAVIVIFDLRYSTNPGDIAYYDSITSGLPIYADLDKDVIFGVKN